MEPKRRARLFLTPVLIIGVLLLPSFSFANDDYYDNDGNTIILGQDDGGAITVTESAPRGISRREAPVGERPLLVVPPLEDVKKSDTGEKDFGSYLVRTSLYRKDSDGRYVLIRREDSAFSQQQDVGAGATEVWQKMAFDDYVNARPGLRDYDKLTISEEVYTVLRDAECHEIPNPVARTQCLEFRKNRRTEWLDGLTQKRDDGIVINENNVPLTGRRYELAAAPLEPAQRMGRKRPELADNPCK